MLPNLVCLRIPPQIQDMEGREEVSLRAPLDSGLGQGGLPGP